MIAELFTSLFGLTVVLPPVLGLLLIVVGMAGHALGLWDLNGSPSRRAPRPAVRPVRPARPAQTPRELPVPVRAQRLDRQEDAA